MTYGIDNFAETIGRLVLILALTFLLTAFISKIFKKKFSLKLFFNNSNLKKLFVCITLLMIFLNLYVVSVSFEYNNAFQKNDEIKSSLGTAIVSLAFGMIKECRDMLLGTVLSPLDYLKKDINKNDWRSIFVIIYIPYVAKAIYDPSLAREGASFAVNFALTFDYYALYGVLGALTICLGAFLYIRSSK